MKKIKLAGLEFKGDSGDITQYTYKHTFNTCDNVLISFQTNNKDKNNKFYGLTFKINNIETDSFYKSYSSCDTPKYESLKYIRGCIEVFLSNVDEICKRVYQLENLLPEREG